MLVVIYAEDIIFLSPFYDAAEHVSTRFQVFYGLFHLHSRYRISANSFRGNYTFLKLTLCTVTFGDST